MARQAANIADNFILDTSQRWMLEVTTPSGEVMTLHVVGWCNQLEPVAYLASRFRTASSLCINAPGTTWRIVPTLRVSLDVVARADVLGEIDVTKEES